MNSQSHQNPRHSVLRKSISEGQELELPKLKCIVKSLVLKVNYQNK